MIHAIAAISLALVACAGSALTDAKPDIVDGDSLRVAGVSVRLAGIDAFERRQRCGAGATAWACGDAATDRLRQLVSAGVRCEPNGETSHRRIVATCFAAGQDVAAILVREGLALADPRYGAPYRALEAQARTARSGAHAGVHMPPWEFRHKHN